MRAQEQPGLRPEDVIIHFDKKKGSVYQMIGRVSELSGYYFVYDSQIVDNDRVVKIIPGDYTLKELIRKITGKINIEISFQDKYILLFLPSDKVRQDKELVNTAPVDSFFTIAGTILDRITGEPVIYATINVAGTSLTTVSNKNGKFMMRLPDSLRRDTIRFSHIGYVNRQIEASLLDGRNIDFFLDQKIIPLQEIVVRVVDPITTIREMIRRRDQNNQIDPVYMTTFFREGIEDRRGMNLTEAVLKIYKTGIFSSINTEQVKVLKMRHLISPGNNDSLVTRLKSSINSCQMLDLIKNLPDFMDIFNQDYYAFSHTDITVLDNRRVYVFSFEPREGITDPLFLGKLYVDAENYALLKATFEINPEYVEKSANVLIIRQSRNIKTVPLSAKYDVSYLLLNGRYYLNHVRADLDLRIKKKRKLFSSNTHVWFEMVNCQIDTVNVKRFPNFEKISTKDFLSEVAYVYDENFWGNFNAILPEETLKELIRKYNLGKN